jgi:hypothetical protein
MRILGTSKVLENYGDRTVLDRQDRVNKIHPICIRLA